jgi:hypothetical protein
MDKGRLRREGESVATREEEEVKEELGDKVVIDALGNEIKVRHGNRATDGTVRLCFGLD